MTGGGGVDEAIVGELERELGIDLGYETMDFDDLLRATRRPTRPRCGRSAGSPTTRVATTSSGVLLGERIDERLRRLVLAGVRRGDRGRRMPRPIAAAAAAAYDRAEAIVQRDVPVDPGRYGTGWALSRDGPARGGENGLGIVRMAGLAWARLMRRGVAAPMAARACSRSASSSAHAAAAADVRDLRDAHRRAATFGEDIVFRQPVTRRRARSSGPSSWSRSPMPSVRR